MRQTMTPSIVRLKMSDDHTGGVFRIAPGRVERDGGDTVVSAMAEFGEGRHELRIAVRGHELEVAPPAMGDALLPMALIAAMTRGEDKSIYPDLGAFGSLYDNRTSAGGAQSWAVGVGLRWSVFDSPRSKRKAAALAEQRAAEQDVRAAVDGVRLQVAMAWRTALTARERHAAASGGAEEGREAFRVLQERRKAGMATLTDELETETAALAAVLEEIRAAAEVAIADAALERAAGEI